MKNPFDNIPDDDKAQRMAAERNRKLRERHPLFADQLDEVTAADIQEAARRHRDRFQTTLDELQAQGEAFRERVRALVTAGEFAELERRQALLPDSPAYLADFFRQQLKRLGQDPDAR